MLLRDRPESQFVVMWSPKTPMVSCTSVLTTLLSRSYYETHRRIKAWSEKLIGCVRDHMTTNPLTWPFVVIPSGPNDHKMTAADRGLCAGVRVARNGPHVSCSWEG